MFRKYGPRLLSPLFNGYDRFMTVGEIARTFGESEAIIRECAKTGELPSLTVGDELMFSKSDVEEWLRSLDAPIASNGDIH